MTDKLTKKQLEKKVEELENELEIFRKMRMAFVSLRNRMEDISDIWDMHTRREEIKNDSVINKFLDMVIREEENKIKEKK